MSHILCFETSSNARSIALVGKQDIYEYTEKKPVKHENRLLCHVEDLLSEAGISLNDLQAVAFGQGPGSFTGIRIACCFAQGLAFGLSCPVIAVSSLKNIALQAFYATGRTNIVVAIDARMNQVYWAQYQINHPADITVIQPDCLAFPQAVTVSEDEEILLVGNAWSNYQEQFNLGCSAFVVNTDIHIPSATTLAQLAVLAYAQDERLTAIEALPAYIRTDVTTPSKKDI